MLSGFEGVTFIAIFAFLLPVCGTEPAWDTKYATARVRLASIFVKVVERVAHLAALLRIPRTFVAAVANTVFARANFWWIRLHAGRAFEDEPRIADSTIHVTIGLTALVWASIRASAQTLLATLER
jgi:hypothetical protein